MTTCFPFYLRAKRAAGRRHNSLSIEPRPIASGGEKPLRKIADAFEGLAATAESKAPAMELAAFSLACSHVSVLIRCLGFAFKFAEKDYVSKVDDLSAASKSISTLQNMIDADIRQDCVRICGSHTRNLLRVMRGVDLVRVIFEQVLASEGDSIRDPLSVAYAQVFSAHHCLAIRKLVGAALLAPPSRAESSMRMRHRQTCTCRSSWSLQVLSSVMSKNYS